ncbi:energy-coupling factor ABC transporter permease [Paenibacillus chitinolyticus]|uniref:Cobalt transport protein CbiM n=1 Tax=Paenibacillus chitinolyticus TaxID=79263 RepID=A0A410WPK0_9BACL|nr:MULTISPECIES: energy-coupling factor ABC transporter permease [Paenibacillus]MCY9590788.1 energy-coupling factor ABC transporter permease [Paenibacillus chitinolyticus]MCY9598695.1 energy-coupling factor ABC transporter permease [Paenibacillus chitinolyticus]QAV16237.1 energy-coupling factor ABC transporter permease [Paenibacillus chitinolyticus]
MNIRKTLASFLLIAGIVCFFLVNEPESAYAMHIMEGFLPPFWALFWWVVFLPFFILGVRALIRITKETPELKLMLGLAGAFTFVLSALKIPSVTGSSSHPTGTGLGAILFGPLPMSVLGSVVLLFQALLLAHGGLTTLGANAFSMAVAGPFVGYAVYKLMIKSTGRQKLSVFTGAALADLTTYLVTSVQLAVAFPAADGGMLASFAKFAGIFAVTQIPLAISEGLLTVLVLGWLQAYTPHEISALQRNLKGADRS